MSYEVADLLDKAAEEIEKRGWCQRRLVDEQGRVCAIGGVRFAFGVSILSDSELLFHRAQKALGVVVGTPSVPEWNDAPGRTKQEVLDAIHLAAKQERIKEDQGDAA